MTKISIEIESGNPYKSGAFVYANIGGIRRPQVAFNIEDYVRASLRFPLDAAEIAYFSSIVYACDRAVNRETTATHGDRWTREYSLQIPVREPDLWQANLDIMEEMLEFLTGDIWHLKFIKATESLFGRKFRADRGRFRNRTRVKGSAVSLFSGGLDSLIGVIDWLEDHPSETLILASTYDAQAESARADQRRLLKYLETEFPNRIQHFVARTGLCDHAQDTNFRSRSMVFIGNAVLAAAVVPSPGTKILVPENGGIAINYPLTPARRGSLSTRTVHPKFLKMANKFVTAMGFDFAIENPYRFMTKGEMMDQCKNVPFLQKVYAHSVSCGKRGHRVRWEDKRSVQCGACVPCMFRRAAIFSVHYPEEHYGYSLSNSTVCEPLLRNANKDLPAILDFANRGEEDEYLWRELRCSGVVEVSLKSGYVDLVKRLRKELESWLVSKRLM